MEFSTFLCHDWFLGPHNSLAGGEDDNVNLHHNDDQAVTRCHQWREEAIVTTVLDQYPLRPLLKAPWCHPPPQVPHIKSFISCSNCGSNIATPLIYQKFTVYVREEMFV
jgi:hypothetical protein